jgi:hypothetical protein
MARATRREGLAPWTLAACALAFGSSCVRPVTAIVVVIDSDLAGIDPRTGALPYSAELSARVFEQGRSALTEVRAGRYQRTPLAWPASFTVLPRGDETAEIPLRIDLGLVVSPLEGGVQRAIARTIVVRFTPGRTTMARVVLSFGCLRVQRDCTTAGVPCTAAQRCAEQGLACGEGGRCVPVEVGTEAFDRDASLARTDARTALDFDAGTDATDAGAVTAVTDANDAAMDTAMDVAMDAGPACPSGQRLCGSACVDTQSNTMNCGACGTVCAGGQTCAMGVCACPSGQQLCGAACVDTQSSAMNCGACGMACFGGQLCVTGACRLDCPAPRTVCGTGAMMVCVDTARDPNHCGGCDRRPTEACNRADDTCDGVVDEGLPATLERVSFGTLACSSAAPTSLACARGAHRTCRAGPCATAGWGAAAVPGAASAQVLCVVGSRTVDVAWSTLARIDPDCDGSAGPGQHHESCLFAADRHCTGAVGMGAGFGTVDASGAGGQVVCLPAASVRRYPSIAFASLTALEAGCDVTSRFSGECFRAIHAYCAARGFVGGFGPVAVSLATGRADLVCVR